MLRFLAYSVSVFCHPLFMLTYMLLILLTVNPYLFGVNKVGDSSFLILMVFFSTVFIPGVAIIMMKLLGLIESIELRDRQERIGPYIITGLFYLWMFRTLLDNPNIPIAFKIFVLGATIALFVAFFINLFSKISMHTVGMGGLLAMVLITMFQYSHGAFWVDFSAFKFQMSMTQLLMVVILLCGMVGTARLLLKAHDPQEIYGGYFIGIISQLIAMQFLI